MADAYSLRQQLSTLIDQITQDIQIIESSKLLEKRIFSKFLFFIARNLSSKHRLEQSIKEATKLVCSYIYKIHLENYILFKARDLERFDVAYGREYKQRIEAVRQRLVCLNN